MDDQTFLKDIQSDNIDVRFAAWRQAGTVSTAVMPQLGKLAADEKGQGKAAREALATMVHVVGKDPKAVNRAAIVKGLFDLTGSAYQLGVQIYAIRLLSNIAGEDSVPAIARFLQNPDLAEEAIYCLERIPGSASVAAIVAAYPNVPESFKPRMLAALGHLRASEGVPLATAAMASANKDLAMAGMKSFARIGQKPAAAPRYPDFAALADGQKLEHTDSMLRYADAQIKSNNIVEAIAIYKTVLERPEPYLQSAALIGLAKTGTPEAAAIIMPKLKSTNIRVRTTAEKAWRSFAGKA